MFKRTLLCLTLSLMLQPAWTQTQASAKSSYQCESASPKLNEKSYVKLGGIEQWVTIKGENCANPMILFLSGGPGNPLSPFSDAIYGAWAKQFTLVQWDQRGAGMTYGRKPPAPEEKLTIAQMTQDGIELARYLTQRYGQKKVILWGSSWGSILGVHMAKAAPELFYAYLGTAQIVEQKENQARSYASLLQLANDAKDQEALAILQGVGAPPWLDPRSFGKVRRVIRKYEAKLTPPAPASWWQPAADYSSAQALEAYEAGEDYSYLNMVGLKNDGLLSQVNLPKLGSDFAIPMFFIQGKHDLLATPDVVQRYHDSLRAPQKQLVILEQAGHDPNQVVVDAQYRLLIEKIRPLIK